MRIPLLSFATLAAPMVLLAFADSAMAATLSFSGNGLDLGPVATQLIDFGAPLALAVVTGLASGAFALFRKKTGWQIDGEVGRIVDQGLARAVDFAASKLKDRASGGIPLTIKDEAVRLAARYAFEKLPEALKHFGITADYDRRLAEMIEARIAGWLVEPAADTRGDGGGAGRASGTAEVTQTAPSTLAHTPPAAPA
ncbi:hypothetical protein [Jiella flava]|uniref:Uncharacterized protein n=1 Tax=Jiella flava TaxID=2816857 RepID=A0A939JX36_9HYPH|nr:hypothetical protein [Jiella flava]MBO0664174.1 hypothetical protein [Jiella flava]